MTILRRLRDAGLILAAVGTVLLLAGVAVRFK